MHALAAAFFGVVTFISGLLGFGPDAVAAVPQAQTAAVVQTQPVPMPEKTVVIGTIAETPAENVAARAFTPAAAPTPRVLGESVVTMSPEFFAQFAQMLRQLQTYLATPAASPAAYPRYGGYLPQADGTTALASPTITGGSILNALTGSFNALSAGTLTLSGTLSGTDATFSGTLTAGTLSVTGISSGGAITAPYFTATSTTATSSFAGSLGIGTTTPNARFTIDNRGFNTNPLSITTNGSAGNYTATNTAIFIRNAAGSEILRLYASDPDSFNFNSGNLYIGYQAGLYQPTDNTSAGYYNTGFGYQTLLPNTTGSDNAGFGFQTLFSNTTGSANTANGSSALLTNITGSYNTASGGYALSGNQSATNTVAVGYGAAQGTAVYSNQGGTTVGYKSGYSFTTGSDYNTLLGYQAGYGITTGSNNIWIGTATSSAGVANLTTGSQNILIGNNISLPSATASGQLNIGNIIFGTGITSTGSTVSSGNIGIGTTTPWARLMIDNRGSDTHPLDITTNGSAGNYTATNTAIFIRNAAGSEILRLYASDPNTSNYNSANLYIGYHTGLNQRTDNTSAGYYNTGLGSLALLSNTTGFSNTALGFQSLYSNTTGYGNIAIGGESLYSNIAGALNIAVGIESGEYLSDGSTENTGSTNSVFLGYDTRSGAGTSTNEVVIGASAVGAGSNSVTLGNTSIAKTLLNGNVGIGTTTPQTKLSIATGGHTYVEIGRGNAGNNAELTFTSNGAYNWMAGLGDDVSNNFYLSTNIGVPSLGAKLTATTGGNIGIGTTTPTAQLHTTGTVRFSNFGAGTLTTDASGNLSVSSDERLKHIDGDFTRGLADVLTITPISYHWNELSGLERETQYAGFSAQNVREAIPEAVGESPNGYLSLNDRPVLAAVVNAIKELAASIASLVSNDAAQDAEIAVLKERIAALEARPVVNPDGTYTITVSSQTAASQAATDSEQTTDDSADTASATSTPPAATSTPEAQEPEAQEESPAEEAAPPVETTTTQ
jgi:hypothetical protein